MPRQPTTWSGGQVRRSRYVNLRSDDAGRLIALSAVAGREVLLTIDDLATWLRVPEDTWVPVGADDDLATIAGLAGCGLLISEEGEGDLAEYRGREEQLREPAWNRHAAVFHAMTRWRGMRTGPSVVSRDRLPETWPPPPHFHTVPKPLATTPLPAPDVEGDLFERLQQRRTVVRGFDPDAAVTVEQLSTILHWVWGCHGTRVIVPEQLTLVRKTSPSGGGQHPTEVYPLIRNVEGIDSGLYHYAVEHHALELVDELAGEDLVALNTRLLADQDHLSSAPVVFYLTCRFARTFWKYPRHAKAYKVVLFDAGHLSQTLQLVCAPLGLGSFVTAAVNEVDIDDLLGLQTFTEASLLALGCGHPAHPEREPVYEPFRPRPT